VRNEDIQDKDEWRLRIKRLEESNRLTWKMAVTASGHINYSKITVKTLKQYARMFCFPKCKSITRSYTAKISSLKTIPQRDNQQN